MKNEASRSDMIDIMKCMQDYLGKEYPSERRVPSGGDQLTCERQVGAQRHTMDGDTIQDRLGLLEPVTEDWHCLVCFLSVSVHAITLIIIHDCIHVRNCTLHISVVARLYIIRYMYMVKFTPNQGILLANFVVFITGLPYDHPR